MAKRIVIIGAGFAGINVAQNLANTDYQITIIDKANHHLFQPLLYQVATAALSPGDIAVPIRSVFTRQKNVKIILGEVTTINKKEREVTLLDGAVIPFDYLIVATGAKYNYFGNDQWEKDGQSAHGDVSGSYFSRHRCKERASERPVRKNTTV